MQLAVRSNLDCQDELARLLRAIVRNYKIASLESHFNFLSKLNVVNKTTIMSLSPKTGNTSLHIAVETNSLLVVNKLLEHLNSEDIKITNGNGDTVIAIARRNNNKNILSKLTHKQNINRSKDNNKNDSQRKPRFDEHKSDEHKTTPTQKKKEFPIGIDFKNEANEGVILFIEAYDRNGGLIENIAVRCDQNTKAQQRIPLNRKPFKLVVDVHNEFEAMKSCGTGQHEKNKKQQQFADAIYKKASYKRHKSHKKIRGKVKNNKRQITWTYYDASADTTTYLSKSIGYMYATLTQIHKTEFLVNDNNLFIVSVKPAIIQQKSNIKSIYRNSSLSHQDLVDAKLYSVGIKPRYQENL